MRIRRTIVASLSAALLLAACARVRPTVSDADLVQRREQRAQQVKTDGVRSMRGLMERTAASTEEDRPVDILVVSGGGDYGAFGAGVLRGWSQLPGGDRMPRFDAVSGVSTGALIAPFAFLGEPDDLATLEDLYRDPKPDWVRPRGLLFFLPANESFAELPGLEREVRDSVNAQRVARIAEEGSKGRRLYVNTTDLDLGCARPFELTQASQQAIAAGDLERVHRILLASAGIPGAFPPREIDSTLYVDGGVTSNILYGTWGSREESFAYQFRRMYPQLPKPRMRYWIILNNQVLTPPQTVQPGWLSVIQRSVDVAIRSSTVTALRHLMTHAELVTLRGDADVEVRWLAIPDDWRPPVAGTFVKETMNNLADLGRRLGADPSSWKRVSP